MPPPLGSLERQCFSSKEPEDAKRGNLQWDEFRDKGAVPKSLWQIKEPDTTQRALRGGGGDKVQSTGPSYQALVRDRVFGEVIQPHTV